jgi:hypothetical protein
MPAMTRCAVATLLLAVTLTCAGADETASHRRPGLWELTRPAVDATNPARTTRVCIDSDTETMLRDVGNSFAKSTCSDATSHAADGKVVADTVCELGGSHATNHTVVTFTGDTSYRQMSTTQFDPPLFGRSEVATEMDGQWVGPCAADMRPGDMITEMGTINLVDRVAQQK